MITIGKQEANMPIYSNPNAQQGRQGDLFSAEQETSQVNSVAGLAAALKKKAAAGTAVGNLQEGMAQPFEANLESTVTDTDTLGRTPEEEALQNQQATPAEKAYFADLERQRQNELVGTIRENSQRDNSLYNTGKIRTTQDTSVDGDLKPRVRAFVSAVDNEVFSLGISNPTVRGTLLEGDKGFSRATNVVANIHNGIDLETNKMKPEYSAVMALITEDVLLNGLDAKPRKEDVTTRKFDDKGEVEEKGTMEQVYVKSDFNKRVGKELHRAWEIESKGPDGLTDIDDASATVLGDMALEMYYRVNEFKVNEDGTTNEGDEGKRILKRYNPTGKTGEVKYSLTPLGEVTLGKSKRFRKNLLAQPVVEPNKYPPVEGEVRPASTAFTKDPKDIKGDALVEESMDNLSQVPHQVLPGRLKLLTSILLSTLTSANKGVDGDQVMGPLSDVQKVFSNILGFGPKKVAEFNAKQESTKNDKEPYSAFIALTELRNNISQYYQSVVANRKGVNYLTWLKQSSGRIFVEQTWFDPTSSKLVRFVLGNPARVTIKPGSRQERNLREMFAMHLVKDADSMLPVERDKALSLATPQMVKDGRRLKEILDGTMTQEQVDAIHEAIANKVPLQDPSFPPYKELALDPERDAALISKINSKGDDGLLYIDGLIDFVNYYDKVVVKKVPYHTQFNAYMDGKTNGLAAMGMMIGDFDLAFMTGVLRVGDKFLLDAGDIRDKLKETLLRNLDTVGLNYDIYQGVPTALTAVAARLFSERDLNKYTTMTFGYGRALQSIKSTLSEFAGVLYEQAVQAEAIENAEERKQTLLDLNLVGFKDSYEDLMRVNSNSKSIGDVLLAPYVSALTETVSYKSIRARAAMKAVAYMSALADEALVLTSPTGMDLRMSGFVTEANKPIKYTITEDGKRKTIDAVSYSPVRTTAAAAVAMEDENTGQITYRMGKQATGQAPVMPAHATDSAVVTFTTTGKSWKRITQASYGAPYLQPIYDAFKVDANGFDVVREEINNNWMDVTIDWDVFGEFSKALRDSDTALKSKLSRITNPDAKIPLGVNENMQMMGYLTEVVKTKKGPVPNNLIYMLQETVDTKGLDIDSVRERSIMQANLIVRKMRDGVGFTFGQQEATPKQIVHFNKLIADTLDTKSLLNNIKYDAKRGQAKIKGALVNSPGGALQYHSH
jgi:hypothetical protein